VRRKDWMFRLVGDEVFEIDNIQCTIKVEPDGLFMYTYDLLVDGKTLEDFCEYISKNRSTWLITADDGVENRIILGNIHRELVLKKMFYCICNNSRSTNVLHLLG